MKTVTMTIDINVYDEEKLIEFAKDLYQDTWKSDMLDDMDLNDTDINKKIIRSIFEVLIGSAPLPYQYNDAGIAVEGFTDENSGQGYNA